MKIKNCLLRTEDILEFASVFSILVMLSDLLFEHKGKTTNSRILDSSVQKQEVTVVGKGKLKGLDVSLIITYWNKPTQKISENRSPSWHYYGEGNGIISNMKDSTETAIVTEYGFGRLIGQKTVWRGSAFYKTSSNSKFAFLNNTVEVFETDVDNVLVDVNEKVWEWR